jgi:DNA-binding beta-propeller fold protein YncE
LIGNGDGTFQPQTTYQEGFAIYSLAAGDFNSDGLVDLAVTSSQDSTIFILSGDGHGGLHVQGTYGTGEAPVSIAVGDFIPKTQAGGPNLVVANFYSNSMSVFDNVRMCH